MKTFRVPELAWHGARIREYELPPEWDAAVKCMAGHNRPALTGNEISMAVRNPCKGPTLRQLAGANSRVAIIFDDMSRVTRCKEIVPAVLKELEHSRVPDENIRFVGATGCHRAMDREDFIKKLGEEVLRRFPVYSHNPFSNCVKAGTTSQGIDVAINEEVMSCDLKIAIGSVVPHRAVGFSGGAKTILPGICSLATIAAFHRYEVEASKAIANLPQNSGFTTRYPAQEICREAAKLAGLDFKIDVIINSLGETAAMYAGEPETTYRLAGEDAADNYRTDQLKDADIVIANTYAKANEFEAGLTIAFKSAAAGADIVLIANAPDGHVPHYLFGTWGTSSRSQHTKINIPQNVHRLYIFTEYPDRSTADYFQNWEKVTLINDWDVLLKKLTASHRNGAKAVVYPNADIQYAPACQPVTPLKTYRAD